MTAATSETISALRAERSAPPDRVWAAAEARLDRPLSEGLNTAHEACDRWARDRARVAMVFSDGDGEREVWTFAELARASSRLARAQHRAGLRRGARVAAIVSRQVEAFIGALAAWRAGLVYMPLFAGLGADALAYRMNAAEVRLVLVDHEYRSLLEEALQLLDLEPRVTTIPGPRGRGLRPGDASFWDEIERHPADFPMVATAPGDPASLMFTSGTTGPPKGCVQPHSLVLTVQPYLRHAFALTPQDMLLAGADPGWSYGLYALGACVMALGHPRVIPTGRFDAHRWLRILEEEAVTYAGAAPSAYRALVAAAGGRPLPESVRGASCGGEPLDSALTSDWADLGGGDLQDGYGQTEAGMLLANLAFEEEPLVPGSLSSVVPGFEVALVDDDGNPVEGQGIIAVRRPRWQASTGYWNEPERWAERWRGDWFLTGDVARRDPHGRWWFVGRRDDLIITSGYNVGPFEVEDVVLEHPDVVEAAVVAADDPDRGSVVRVVVVLRRGASAEGLKAELVDAVRHRVGRHAVPRIVDVVDELPRTQTGKVRRRAVREIPVGGHMGTAAEQGAQDV